MYLHEGIRFEYLSPQEQQLYKVFLKAFYSMASSFNCPPYINRSVVDLMKVMQAVLADNPSVIYFDKTKIETEASLLWKRIYLSGVYNKQQAEKMNILLNNTANKIFSFVMAESHDEYSLIVNLHEYLQKNIRYDKDELKAPQGAYAIIRLLIMRMAH